MKKLHNKKMGKTFKFAFLSLFFTTLTYAAEPANFSGHWSGSGTLTMKNPFTGSETSPCSKIEITIEQLPTQLTVQRYNAQCEKLGSDWGPHVMEIRDEKIFEDDEETGTLIGNLLKTLQYSGGVAYAFNMLLKDANETQATPVLESYYGVKNMVGTIVIEGNLTPVSTEE